LYVLAKITKETHAGLGVIHALILTTFQQLVRSQHLLTSAGERLRIPQKIHLVGQFMVQTDASPLANFSTMRDLKELYQLDRQISKILYAIFRVVHPRNRHSHASLGHDTQVGPRATVRTVVEDRQVWAS
jgi:hypothetical protein